MIGALFISSVGRVDERERSLPIPAPTLVDCATLAHPTVLVYSTAAISDVAGLMDEAVIG
ncbi:hypothetical protein BDD21_1234 [Thiocapsa rosea]|uniref:Uncharacterized protein n=1 Tax=Thiocapsa rosea TaxID=69360 RepID=A0A495V396_9GAMM|nr:hypothetical protein BDD21_1234 [Thiocapsa rosea]